MKELQKVISQRIKKARTDMGLTPDEVVSRVNALKSGQITRSAYYNWEAAERPPKTENILLLSEVFGKPPAWLSGFTNDDGTTVRQNYVTANSPVLTTKTGSIPVPQACGNTAFHTYYLSRRGLDSNKLLSIQQLDKSMSPLLEEDDEILIDCSRKTVHGVDLFGIVVNGHIWIRRIREEVDGSFTIQAQDQAQYPDQKLSKEELADIQIVGRVTRIAKDL